MMMSLNKWAKMRINKKADLNLFLKHEDKGGKLKVSDQVDVKWFSLVNTVYILSVLFPFSSLGCGIGYGYLHRIPTRPFEEGKKISFPGTSSSEPVSPLKDGFTEVRMYTFI